MTDSVEDGDLAFYRPDPGDVAGKIIAEFTDGPYCHVGIVYGDRMISAQMGGVVEQRASFGTQVATGRRCAFLPAGLAWLVAQIGKPYSYADVAAAALDLAWNLFHPALVFGPLNISLPTPSLGTLIGDHRFDCSSLATRFLGMAHYPLPRAVAENPDVMTPNALYRLVTTTP